MDGSSLRTRCRLSGGLLLPLLGAALVSCGNGPAASTDSPDASFEGTTTCTQQVTPDDQSFVVSSSSDRGIPTVFSLKASRRDGYNDLSQTVDEGGQRLVTVQSHQSASRTELTIEFGGPSGNEQRVTATNDGKSMLMSINGRVLSPFTVGSDPKSLHFADGAAMDSVTPVDPQMLQTLGHIHEQAAAVIPTCGQTAAGGHLVQVLPTKTDDVEADACKFACGAFGSSCGCCSSCCEVAYAGCAGAALLGESQCVALAIAAAVATGGAAAVPSAGAIALCTAAYVVAGGECISEDSNCTNGCATGGDCVGPECAGGTSTTEAPGLHCSPGAVCCNGPILQSSNSYGTCCDSNADCCGGQCLEGTLKGDQCTDSAKGVSCDSSGQVCGPPDNGFCCPGGTPTCRIGTATQTLCCATGAGDTCQGSTICCPSATPNCVNDSACCGADNTNCGPSAGCCPPPGTCSGGQCCNPPMTACGPNCCASGDTCTSARDICCGPGTLGSACGANDCCLPDETCVGTGSSASCCATASMCGGSCCGSNEVCTNGACTAPSQPTLFLDDLGTQIGSSNTSNSAPEVLAGSNYTVKGVAFPVGTVTLSVTSNAGTRSIGTVTATSTGFTSAPFTFQIGEIGAAQVVATEGASQASVAVVVESPQ